MKRSKWVLAALLAALTLSACLAPRPYPGGPGGRSLSQGQIKQMAREAMADFIIRRYGRDSSPRTSRVSIRSVSREESQVVGRLTYCRSSRSDNRIRVYFRCFVDRYDGRVRNIDLY